MINRRLSIQLSWSILDQGIYTLTNVALTLLVAISVDARSLGAFALLYVCGIVIMGCTRALTSEPIAVQYAPNSSDEIRLAISRASGVTTLAGLATAVLGVAIGFSVGLSAGSAFIALGMALPAIVMQDLWRSSLIVLGRSRDAFINDCVWAFAELGAVVYLFAQDHRTVTGFIVAWGVGAWSGAILGPIQLRIRPRITTTRSWLHEVRDLAPRFVLEFLAVAGVGQLVVYIVALVAGLGDAGAYRAAQVLFGPLNVMIAGSLAVALPELARRRETPATFQRGVRLYRYTAISITALWAIAALVAINAAGHTLFGDTGSMAAHVAPGLVLHSLGAADTTASFLGLRALAAAGRTLRTRAVVSFGASSAAFLGAVLGGAELAAWGVGVAMVLGAVLWRSQLASAVRLAER